MSQHPAEQAAPPCAPPDFSPGRPALPLPAGACDAHAHVIGPAGRYPLDPARVYTPPECSWEAYRHLLDRLGIARAVLVQPSVYGEDNRALLDALRAGGERLRGVAVVPPAVEAETLKALHGAGVRGVRVNLVDRHDRSGQLPLGMLGALAERIAPLGWHQELLVHVDAHAAELRAFADWPVPVVFGHLGYMRPGAGTDDPGFAALLDLAGSGKAWVKLTGPYRLGAAPLPYPHCDAPAAALAAAAPDRLVWGTDWPHVMLKGQMPNDAQLVDLLPRWLPDAALRRRVLVDNPARLYDFPR